MQAISICRANLIWEYPDQALFKPLIYIGDDNAGYMIGVEDIIEVVDFLKNNCRLETPLLNQSDGFNLDFVPPNSKFTFYLKSIFGRKPIPWQVWQMEKLKKYQKKIILDKLKENPR